MLHNSLLILGEALSALMSEILFTMGYPVPRVPGVTPEWGTGSGREEEFLDVALHDTWWLGGVLHIH